METKKDDTRPDLHDAPRCDSPSILESLKGSDFILSAARAETEAARAVKVRDDLAMWMKRLQPYFDLDCQMTVAEALQRYLNDKRRMIADKG